MTRPNDTSPLSPRRLSGNRSQDATTNAAALYLDQVSRFHQDGPTTVTALDKVSLTIEPGELVAVMGPSGSGKSTLLNVAGTLDTVSDGRVLVAGVDVSHLSPQARAEVRRTHVGYVFQDASLITTLTGADQVSLPLDLTGTNRKHARAAAVAALEEINLAQTADRFPSEISGGQQQRVAVARALIGDRHLFLADEPTGALDSVTAESVMSLLRDRVNDGAAGLLVTHEPRFAAWADRTVHLRDGRIVE
ncbi:MAG: ABC transporter ATP-binding protein [Corynebacterium sp.]|nr:ABC transporter ATP-binding protein [Corynebacterium sp.]